MMNLKYQGFSKSQTQALEYAYFSLGLPEDEMSCIARSEYSPAIMLLIIDYFEQNVGDDSVKEFKEYYEDYLKKGFSDDEIEQIFEGLEYGLTTEEVDLYAQKVYNDLQMEAIKEGLLLGLTVEEARNYADPKLSPEEMEGKMYQLLADKKKVVYH